MLELSAWENFFVIVGSSAGALIGLQFGVIALIAERPPPRAAEAGPAFLTPTIVHFSSVLLLSALLSAPWNAIGPVAILWGLTGAAGIGYCVFVAKRMVAQAAYQPQLEDWMTHILLPLSAYALLGLSAFAAVFNTHAALFFVAGAMLLLLLTGIYNAWDNITFLVFVKRPEAKREKTAGSK